MNFREEIQKRINQLEGLREQGLFTDYDQAAYEAYEQALNIFEAIDQGNKARAAEVLKGRLALIAAEQYDVGEYKDALELAVQALTADKIDRKKALAHVDDVPFIKDHPHIGDLWKAWIEEL